MKKNICVVPGCIGTDATNDSLKFHQIPKDAELRKRWLKAINRTEPEINKKSRVCSKHFKNHDYAVTRLNYAMGKSGASGSKNTCEFKALKEEAVPNQHLPQKSTFKIKISKKDSGKQIKVEEVKVKEEKIEKPDKSDKLEKVKMPKRPAIDMSPPRSRTQSRRAASKEALKQMQLLLDDENDAVEIPDDDIIPIDPSPPPPPPPPKKKYKLSHRKSSDGNDRDVIVLKTITNRDAENTLELDCWVEQLEEVQKNVFQKYQDEENELQARLDSLINQSNGKIIHKGDLNTIIEVSEQVQNAIQGAQQSYQLVVDPRVGLVMGAISPQSTGTQQKVYQGKVQVAQNLQQTTATPTNATSPIRANVRTRNRAGTTKITPPAVITQTRGQVVPPNRQVNPQRTQAPAQTKGQGTTQTRAQAAAPQTRGQTASPQTRGQVVTQTRNLQGKKQMAPVGTNTRARVPPANTFTTTVRPDETNVQGGLATGGKKVVVDLTAEDNNKSAPDSREIAFNKLQGKTYPSLVVVARPHLRVQDLSTDRPKLDAKVKSVLMHAPTKFTEWLIQQGLVRSEQKCSMHTNTQLKLGMYSDVSKFPYSGGYVWISECCPQRFVSVFSGSLFEGSPHPPMVILKLLYHWSCQTNIQNVTQWVKVDNLYVKGMFTWLRSICTVALHTHIRQIGGPGVKVEVGVISLGTTSQDGNQRQVKVEVLGVLESDSKLIRLRAVEPQAEGDRNYKKRFSKILEPVCRWVHPQSILVADLTVDKQTLISMGFQNVIQYSSNIYGNNNQIMEYLRRIVPRMFQNTLSLLSRQIIQQFLDELVWREWFGTSALLAFDNLVTHLSEQTRFESGQSLIVRLNKVAQNPFKSWAINVSAASTKVENPAPNVNQANKKQRNTRKPDPPKIPPTKNVPHTFLSSLKVNQAAMQETRPPKSTSPDVPEHMVPLESYYYGTIDTYSKTPKITLNMKCPFCKSTFDNNIQLMSHLFKHAHNVSMDAQLCRYCLTSVATANDLLKHIATSHPAETKFDNGFCCLICETQYMNPFVLGKHMSKEHYPSELPYQCGTCSYRCSNHKQAIDHFYKTHDNGPTIQCPFCLKSTTVFTASRNIVQNMNYFIQHLQKHQRKQFARRCGKCNLWFVQKDVLKDHQNKMHVSQRGKHGLVPWTAPRNGIMVPKSKMDKYPVDAEVINFAALNFNLSSGLMCKECNTLMDTPKHFPSFESCQNPNCQYSTCCTNAMQEHNAKCSKTSNPVSIDPLPFQMFCICGFSNTDGNQMAKHLAICERKSAYPSKAAAKGATVTHSMLDVLGLVRKPEEKPKQKNKKLKRDTDIIKNPDDDILALDSLQTASNQNDQIEEVTETNKNAIKDMITDNQKEDTMEVEESENPDKESIPKDKQEEQFKIQDSDVKEKEEEEYLIEKPGTNSKEKDVTSTEDKKDVTSTEDKEDVTSTEDKEDVTSTEGKEDVTITEDKEDVTENIEIISEEPEHKASQDNEEIPMETNEPNNENTINLDKTEKEPSPSEHLEDTKDKPDNLEQMEKEQSHSEDLEESRKKPDELEETSENLEEIHSHSDDLGETQSPSNLENLEEVTEKEKSPFEDLDKREPSHSEDVKETPEESPHFQDSSGETSHTGELEEKSNEDPSYLQNSEDAREDSETRSELETLEDVDDSQNKEPEKESEDIEKTERGVEEELGYSEKKLGDEIESDLQNHVSQSKNVIMETSEMLQEKEPAITTDDIQNLLSDVVGESEETSVMETGDGKQSDALTEMMDVRDVDTHEETPTPMETE